MAGLTRSGFEAETLEVIKSRIEGKLDAINPGFDFSPDSPDGVMLGIMSFEFLTHWNQLNEVYKSYNPQVTTGAALKNLGLITGLPFGVAQRSYATLETQGVAGTIIPRQSLLTDNDGNEFYTSFETAVPNNLQVVSSVAGVIPVPSGSIVTIKTPVTGWTGVTQTIAGTAGTSAQTPQQYRNTRQRTVMRNSTSIVDTMQARLIELGVSQANVLNNTNSIPLPDGTPANTIHVTVGEVGAVPHANIAKVILDTGALGCPTFGNTTVTVDDSQGVSHDVSFSVAAPVAIQIDLDVTYLSQNTAGADDGIISSLEVYVNSLLSGEDVIWSRLFGYITPFSKAQINTITVGVVAGSQGISNVTINDNQYATIATANINLTVT
mgnify:CR=1 FL=1|tara:strand:+ start:1210 stop:2349 length:1140 start_codon:yes stop_codon:yes gene_type:complete